MIVNATFEQVDFWCRVIIKTEKGTRFCDTNLVDKDRLMENPSLGDWHTMSRWNDEPCLRILPEVEFIITEPVDT